ncbi:restriction endonuclease [Natronococcus occultus]|uniref:Restriction endonuclease n=1 Tax=Natronococcus occultus SP4 TaxID=694430 RepID=L0K5K0_9EURY|nr:restriction endonuclease [Natronococcus occultus]AGB39800.1 restriction endonuclease [Natronococcus occultus SP4]
MSLTERIVDRIGNDRYADALPDDLREQAQEDKGVDSEDIDLAVSTGEVYPDKTEQRAFATTLAVAVVLWLMLLVAGGRLSPVQLLATGFSIDDLLTFTVYGYFAVALAVGTGVSAAHWYVRRAPSEIREHLDASPLVTFVTTTVISGLVFLLAALGGWLLVMGALLGAIVALLVLLVAILLSIPLALYGLLKWDRRAIGVSVGAFVAVAVLQVLEAIWPSGIPVEYYVLMMTYALAIVLAGMLLDTAVSNDLEEYRDHIGEIRVSRDLLETDVERLRSSAPAGYPVKVPVPDPDVSESATDSEAVVAEAFDLVKAYDRHIDARPDSSTRRGHSTVANLLLTAAAATHPSRCISPTVATDAADALEKLVAACEAFEDEGFDDDQLTETHVWSVCRDLESADNADAGDIQRLWDACEAFEDRLTDLEDRKEFRERVDELRSGLASTFDDPPADYLDVGSTGDQNWERLEREEQVLALAQQAADLRREYPRADLPVALLSVLRDDAINARDLDPYDLLVEVGKRALDTAAEYGAPFDRARSQVLTIAREDPTGRADDLDALREVLERGVRITEFLDRVDHDHPSVEAAEWRDALATAVDDAFPNILRPIDSQIEAMGDGLWERSDLFAYDWQEFESLVGSLYADDDYDIEVTTDTNDGGVDVWARSPGETVAVQVKQHSPGNTVGRRVLQQLASTIAKGSADRVVVVTSAEFANTAIEYAAEFGPEMDLVDGDDLVRRLSASDLPPPRTIEP